MPPAVRTKVATAPAVSAMTVGSVLLIETPVSPETPLTVIVCALLDGGMMTARVAPLGTVIVFAPETRSTETFATPAVTAQESEMVLEPSGVPARVPVRLRVPVIARFVSYQKFGRRLRAERPHRAAAARPSPARARGGTLAGQLRFRPRHAGRR